MQSGGPYSDPPDIFIHTQTETICNYAYKCRSGGNMERAAESELKIFNNFED